MPLNTQCKGKCTWEERFAKCNEKHVQRERTHIMTIQVSPRHGQRHSKTCTRSVAQHVHKCTCLPQALSTHIPRVCHKPYLSTALAHWILSPFQPLRKLPASKRELSRFAQGPGWTVNSRPTLLYHHYHQACGLDRTHSQLNAIQPHTHCRILLPMSPLPPRLHRPMTWAKPYAKLRSTTATKRAMSSANGTCLCCPREAHTEESGIMLRANKKHGIRQ